MWGILGSQEQARSAADRSAVSPLLLALVEAQLWTRGTKAGSRRVEIPNGTRNFRKRVQLREVDRNFRNECPETVCFGRMECARNFLLQRWTFGLFPALYIFFTL